MSIVSRDNKNGLIRTKKYACVATLVMNALLQDKKKIHQQKKKSFIAADLAR